MLTKTASTSLHLINTSAAPPSQDESTAMEANPIPYIFLEDSWFTSMHLVENISGLYIGNLKSNLSRCPNNYPQDTMND